MVSLLPRVEYFGDLRYLWMCFHWRPLCSDLAVNTLSILVPSTEEGWRLTSLFARTTLETYMIVLLAPRRWFCFLPFLRTIQVLPTTRQLVVDPAITITAPGVSSTKGTIDCNVNGTKKDRSGKFLRLPAQQPDSKQTLQPPWRPWPT